MKETMQVISPEGLALGTVGKRQYAFVGLERMGGVMTYDITNPLTPVFVDYSNNRDFTVAPADAPAAGDLGPEGLLFIDAKDSPTRTPLLRSHLRRCRSPRLRPPRRVTTPTGRFAWSRPRRQPAYMT